jgi:hypothetical protein
MTDRELLNRFDAVKVEEDELAAIEARIGEVG